jgi:hypothetical protein
MNEHVLEKFEIERVYWERQAVDWGIVTELEMAHNISFVHGYADFLSIDDEYTYKIKRRGIMNIEKIEVDGRNIVVVRSSEILIWDVQSALDLIETAQCEVGCNRIIINKALLSENFFDLKIRLAGEILQKFINYGVKIAIIGDFSGYSSKSLKDFIYEYNNGNAICCLPNHQQANEKLSMLK